jgi:hypothetical protein
LKYRGIICGILAAICYGTNPFGALPLYREGVNTSSVLFYRFSMAVLMTISVHEVGATPTAIMGALVRTITHTITAIVRKTWRWKP